MSAFWSWYVIVIVAANILGAVWILFVNMKSAPGETTGHVWDGDLSEYNKPLPRWWVGLFVGSVLFAIGYLVLYPGLGAFPGTAHWTSAKQHDADVAATNARLERLLARFRGVPVETLSRDAEALTVGHNLFANNCAACHGSDARGATGFPNLTDDDWLYGGSADAVVTTISGGRGGVMPPWGEVVGESGVAELANYVLSLSDQPHDAARAEAGKTRFATLCVACHGADGKGNQAIGAPNLADDTWLYGGDLATVETTIRGGRNGQMPAWGAQLGEDRVRLVAAWVLAQSQAPANAAGGGQP